MTRVSLLPPQNIRGNHAIPVTFALVLGACATAQPGDPAGTSYGNAAPAGGAATAQPEFSQERGAVTLLPEAMVVTGGDGPALFLSEANDSPAVGYVSGGTPVVLAGDPVAGRAPVLVEGPLKARGWVPLERLALRVRQRGKVRGTPVYLGPGDYVGVQGRSAEAGLLQLQVAANLGREGVGPIGPFSGEYPESRLSGTTTDFSSLEGPTAGPSFSLPAGQSVPLYDQPDGNVVATLPALTPPLVVTVLRDRGGWKGVRVGAGPYLVGFVQTPLTAAAAPASSPTVGPPPATAAGTLPLRLQEEASYPLFRLPPGTRIQFDGKVIGLLQGQGFARQLNRWEETSEADVFAAANDDLAVRGMVSLVSLQPAEVGAASASQATTPIPPAPPAAAPPAPTAAPIPPAPAPARRSLVSPGS